MLEAKNKYPTCCNDCAILNLYKFPKLVISLLKDTFPQCILIK